MQERNIPSSFYDTLVGKYLPTNKAKAMNRLNERQQNIILQVFKKGQIKVSELAQMNQVSEVTIRQDLTLLEENHYLKRTHGYAVAMDSDDIATRISINFALKQKLATFAASLVNHGDYVFIEGGSTNSLLAKYIAYNKAVTIITPSCYIARMLKDSPVKIFLLGGEYQKDSDYVVGRNACRSVLNMEMDKTFIGIDGFDEDGISGKNRKRAELVNTLLERNLEHYIITDSSKCGRSFPHHYSCPYPLAGFITDSGIAPEYVHLLNKMNIPLHKVEI
ncbi:DeoR family transcriptional regulator [Mesocricetibacter intestinalis]|uniref:DeoR family transcriptional regulator n=1 Tax=Mesocricetibacter intestinalis TaxID=1521930 RepID=A0A4R6VG55_9PAST|nr:DeoR/GlpR family DNA-binding transcription regulator [Mesocricetibacter intestinalis]TDQ56636.1 DeoR family transcriptional regulator [Mesocricetibacter intestinalis]